MRKNHTFCFIGKYFLSFWTCCSALLTYFIIIDFHGSSTHMLREFSGSDLYTWSCILSNSSSCLKSYSDNKEEKKQIYYFYSSDWKLRSGEITVGNSTILSAQVSYKYIEVSCFQKELLEYSTGLDGMDCKARTFII